MSGQIKNKEKTNKYTKITVVAENKREAKRLVREYNIIDYYIIRKATPKFWGKYMFVVKNNN
jgi:hypothetical protein